jgi:hypothetical protein
MAWGRSPRLFTDDEQGSDDFGVWKLESGAWLIVNMEKEINPLQWNRP